MFEVPIYNNVGVIVETIKVNDNLEYINGRVSKGEKYYYKGIGIPYNSHYIYQDDMTNEYNFLGVSDIFYLGNCVSKKSYQNKFGIFQEKYQPHFTDWIGTCGIKELNILENLYDESGFERNAIEVFEYQIIDKKHEQYYLKVDYPNGRKNYLSDPNPKDLRDLIDYMIINNWNFPWDKNSISDLSNDSKVTDVADIFKSSELSHKIGTVYSILYSLFNSSKNEYFNFCLENNLNHINRMSFIYNTLSILLDNHINISSLIKENEFETYKNVVLNYLVTGKNCGFCGAGSCKGRKDSNQLYGEEIRDEYIKRATIQLTI